MNDRPADRQDLDSLLGSLLGFAQQTLNRYGEFYPFGAVLTTEGEVVLQGGQLIGTDRPPSQAIINLILDGVRSQANTGEIRAAGICYDVRMTLPDGTATDAIDVSLEHRSGLSVLVSQPYAKRRLRGFEYRELIAQPGEPRIFG